MNKKGFSPMGGFMAGIGGVDVLGPELAIWRDEQGNFQRSVTDLAEVAAIHAELQQAFKARAAGERGVSWDEVHLITPARKRPMHGRHSSKAKRAKLRQSRKQRKG